MLHDAVHTNLRRKPDLRWDLLAWLLLLLLAGLLAWLLLLLGLEWLLWLLWEWEWCARVDGVWVGNEVGVGQFRDAGELRDHLLALGRVLASSKCTSTLAKKTSRRYFPGRREKVIKRLSKSTKKAK